MDLRGLRWPRLVVSVLVTFGVLLGGFALYRHQAVDGSLLRIFHAQAGVQDVVLETVAGQVTVAVTLGPDTQLPTVFRDLTKTADRLLGSGAYRLELRDKRGEAVEAAYYKMHFSLQEANATGQFTAMAAKVDEIAGAAALEHFRVDVGEDNIYVALSKDGQYLYEVLPRRQEG